MLLGPVTADSRELAPRLEVRRADHPDAEALIAAYLAELAERLGGFDAERSVSAEPDEMSPPAGIFLVLYEGLRPVACGGLKTLEPEVGEIKRMYVAPDVRGRGYAKILLAELEARARAAGHRRIVLDTAEP